MIVKRVQQLRTATAKLVTLGIEYSGIQKSYSLILIIHIAVIIINSDLAMTYSISVSGLVKSN